MKGEPLNIAIAGLTAAGKTTHARRLADELGYTYVSSTEILLTLLGVDTPSNGAWFTDSVRIEQARRGDQADSELDRRLVKWAATRSGVVFDSWVLAWICPTPIVRVWLESDEPSRIRKCFVSQEATRMPISGCAELLREKDGASRSNFIRRYGFDLFVDRAEYDLVLCNSHLIPHATADSAALGIDKFAPILRKAVELLLGGGSYAETSRLQGLHPAEILRIGRRGRRADRLVGERPHLSARTEGSWPADPAGESSSPPAAHLRRSTDA